MAVITSGYVLFGLQPVSNQNETLTDSEPTFEAADFAPNPKDAPRTGVPFLAAYPLAIAPVNAHQVEVSDYPWLLRTVRFGETNINEKEMNEYFNIAVDNNLDFGVKMPDGNTKYFSIEFREYPISLAQHNAKAYKLDVAPEKFVTVELKAYPWLKELIDDAHAWKVVDPSVIQALNQLAANQQDYNFKVVFEDGHSEFYNIRYAGPEPRMAN